MNRFRCSWLFLAVALAAVACQPPRDTGEAFRAEVQAFLDDYSARWIQLAYASNQAEWDSNTRIVEGDDTNRKRTEAANQALAEFTGSVEVIEKLRAFLDRREELEPLQVRQLEVALFKAANLPQTVPDLVQRRIAAEAKQTEDLFGFDFRIDDKSVTTNEIDSILVESDDLDTRLEAWRSSKEVGKVLKDGLAELVELRNSTVRSLGYGNFFEYQVSEFDMDVGEMIAMNEQFIRELWPLYRELHTWARYELAERYGAEVPEALPAHWLPNRWGQDWGPLVTVEGLDLDGILAEKDPEWIVRQGEEFYKSVGFDPLPAVFWEKSSLYPVPADAPFKKNNHASAWHLDYRNDVRSLMSVEANERWWVTVHHELGHIYYYMAYSRPEVPVLLRRGANRGFHEAVGYLFADASLQQPFLVERGLISGDVETDETQVLLKEALDTVVFIPFSAGTMTHFERDLYEGLPEDEYNRRWWSYVAGFQGIEPPSERGEDFCDPCTKTHINDDPAQYYDYAISYILLHQLHAHIAKEILGQDPHATNYFGRQDVGAFVKSILELGNTRDWREVMRDKLGSEISAAPMLAYFEPLMEYLRKVNEGRTYTLPESPPAL